MNHSVYPVLVAIFFVVPANPAPKGKETPPPAPAAYWPTTFGLIREFEHPGGTTQEVVTAVTRKDEVTTVETVTLGTDAPRAPRNKVEVRKDGLFLTEEAGQKWDSPVCLLKFPLTAGDKWEQKLQRPDLGAVEFKTEVGETATVETPAGKFEAVKVMRSIVRAGGRPDITAIEWYAKELGPVKTDAGVLKSHKVVKELPAGAK